MFSDEEIKESSLMRPGDEIISIREVCLVDKYDKKYLGGETLLPNSGRDLEVPRYLRDGLYEGLEARFAWTEEDGNIASLVSEPGFGSGNSFGKSLDAALNNEIKEADSNYNSTRNAFERKSFVEPQLVSSSSGSTSNLQLDRSKRSYKVDKTDPRSRYHYVKYVKRHGRIVKLWECGICSREFQHQYTLMRHLPTHTDERNFHCDACAKSFRQLSTLSQHRAIHSAERPYACEVCNKTFNRVSTLISHRKTHSNEKPYKCHICPKGFHQKGNLRNHLFTHTNERPYRCNICMKGFNQQSNLVCHKNKAHQDESTTNNVRNRNPPHTTTQAPKESQSDNRTSQQCEVSSSVGPYIPEPKDWSTTKANWNMPKPDSDLWNEVSWGNNGVIVDPINTYHMGVALATRQTPFALLKSDTGTPVLVKVVDTKLPGGKQMLVPATAEDLRIGGKIILDNEESPEVDVQLDANAVQIRVPVVATVVPKMRPGGRLQLSVEEPHHAYHSALPTEIGEVKVEPCTSTASNPQRQENKQLEGNYEQSMRSVKLLKHHGVEPPLHCYTERHPLKEQSVIPYNQYPPAGRLWSTPASPPLDLISLDLFEPMGCIPLGPQITSVDIDQPPHSDDSDIFIGKFEESIPLSDSD